jgi:hypothetical protein
MVQGDHTGLTGVIQEVHGAGVGEARDAEPGQARQPLVQLQRLGDSGGRVGEELEAVLGHLELLASRRLLGQQARPFGFDLPPFGDVGRHPDEPRDLVARGDRATVTLDPADGAVRAHDPVLHREGGAGSHRPVHHLEHGVAVLGVQQLGVGVERGGSRSRLHAEDPLHGLIPPHGAGRLVPLPHAEAAGLEGQQQSLLVAIAGLGRLTFGRDILGHPDQAGHLAVRPEEGGAVDPRQERGAVPPAQDRLPVPRSAGQQPLEDHPGRPVGAPLARGDLEDVTADRLLGTPAVELFGGSVPEPDHTVHTGDDHRLADGIQRADDVDGIDVRPVGVHDRDHAPRRGALSVVPFPGPGRHRAAGLPIVESPRPLDPSPITVLRSLEDAGHRQPGRPVVVMTQHLGQHLPAVLVVARSSRLSSIVPCPASPDEPPGVTSQA